MTPIRVRSLVTGTLGWLAREVSWDPRESTWDLEIQWDDGKGSLFWQFWGNRVCLDANPNTLVSELLVQALPNKQTGVIVHVD